MYTKVPDYDDVIDVTGATQTACDAVGQLCSRFHVVLFAGFSGSGKSYLLDRIDTPRKTVTKWSKKPIYKMIRQDTQLTPDQHRIVAGFEKRIFSSVIESQDHVLCVEGWFSAISHRKRILSLTREPKLILWMDGPDHLLAERMKQTMPHLTNTEIRWQVDNFRRTVEYPSRLEGSKIIWVNSFGKEGVEYMQQTLGV